jgi:hypothetical protein
MASENRDSGYDRIAGGMANLGYVISDQICSTGPWVAEHTPQVDSDLLFPHHRGVEVHQRGHVVRRCRIRASSLSKGTLGLARREQD